MNIANPEIVRLAILANRIDSDDHPETAEYIVPPIKA
jgi:hypothetical protein